jgi:hypothetical protein
MITLDVINKDILQTYCNLKSLLWWYENRPIPVMGGGQLYWIEYCENYTLMHNVISHGFNSMAFIKPLPDGKYKLNIGHLQGMLPVIGSLSQLKEIAEKEVVEYLERADNN